MVRGKVDERIWYHDFSLFRKRLADLIRENNIRLSRLSESTGITRATIASYTYGSRMPYVDKLVILSEYFGVSTEYLLGLTLDSDEIDVGNYERLLKSLFPILTDHQVSVISALIAQYIKSNLKG